jgi:3-dehydroquinate synthase
LARSAQLCDAEAEDAHTVVITDENVQALYAELVSDVLSGLGAQVDVLIVEPGEPSKSADVAAELWEGLLDAGADRKSVVVALGGGVVGDLAGFVAATYARGLRLVQIPTTLLAQVDSSVGGKVGINLPGAKNMIGAFWQPCGVLIDVEVLKTLPDREYRAGLAEVVKYGVIQDAEFFAYLEANVEAINVRDPAVLTPIVVRCCRLKADVVEKDEREETGLRAILNYGHTFCHALEAATGYQQLLHGEGVAIGMMCAARLAQRLGRVDAAFTTRQRSLLEALRLPLEVPAVEVDDLIELMYHDKKVEHGKLRFVLPSRLGHVELVRDVGAEDIEAALAD